MKGAPPPRGNVPKTSLRWSLDSAARELAMSPNTLQKVLNQASVTAGEDGCFSTAQLMSGVYGRMHEEKLKVQQQLARRYELANRVAEGELLNRASITAGLASLADAITCRIRYSKLNRSEQDDLLTELSSIPVIVSDAVSRQAKRQPRRSKNGEAPKEE
jgi:hypothetical protein